MLNVLNLQLFSHDEELLVQQGPGATKSVRTAFKAACEEGFSAVDPATTKGQHFVRIAARSMALQLKQKTGGGHQRTIEVDGKTSILKQRLAVDGRNGLRVCQAARNQS